MFDALWVDGWDCACDEAVSGGRVLASRVSLARVLEVRQGVRDDLAAARRLLGPGHLVVTGPAGKLFLCDPDLPVSFGVFGDDVYVPTGKPLDDVEIVEIEAS